MGKETIMLASKYDPKKQVFPAYVSEKLDGVAADLYVDRKGKVQIRSRQNEPITSCLHLQEELAAIDDMEVGMHFIGELYIPEVDFKDISGMVRRKSVQHPELQFHVYDFYMEGHEHMDYVNRMAYLHDLIEKKHKGKIKLVPIAKVKSADEVEDFVKILFQSNPTAEGVMVRQMSGKGADYQIGKRPKGMAKYKVTETADLKVVGFEEAIDAKTGAPLGMVGRIILEYNGREIGAGAGTLTHKERKEIFENPEQYIGRIAEIPYMPDESYEALREARFGRWRPDKD